jgi:phosphohistidine phosphatase
MDLYLIRHAEAVPLTQMDVNADEDRPLTEHGVAQSRALSAVLQRRGVTFHSILTSPLLRARQTAQELVDNWPAPAPEVRVCEPLAPEVKIQKLAKSLLGIDDEAVALVGHMPDLGDFAAWLIGSKKARIDFEKAGVALIRAKGYIDKGAGKLEWLVTPEWFM